MTVEKNVKVLSLVLDYDIYPRSSIDSQRIGYIAEAYASGATLPPIIAEKKIRKVVEGFKRCKAKINLEGKDAVIDVEWRQYESEKELFLESIRLNSDHGQNLDRHDRVHCALLSKRWDVTTEELASALHMREPSLEKLLEERIAFMKANQQHPIALKRTLIHMAGKRLSKDQEEANKKLGGMSPKFFIGQVLLLLKNDLMPMGDERLYALLGELKDEVEKFLSRV